MREEKKKYLNSYLLQEAKIERLHRMTKLNPYHKALYDTEITNSLNLRKEIEFKISMVDNGILSEVLFQKYILGKTLEEIGYILNYSKRQIERMHIKALEKFKL